MVSIVANPTCLQSHDPDTAMDLLSWFHDLFDPAKWYDVARQAEVVVAALDDMDIAHEARTVCHAYRSRSSTSFESRLECDDIFSERELLTVQVSKSKVCGQRVVANNLLDLADVVRLDS